MKTSLALMSVLLGILSAFSLPAFAGRQLTGEELKKLMTGKTLYVFNEKAGKLQPLYFAADGTYQGSNFKGVPFIGKWWIDDKSNHCVESPYFNGCYPIFDNDGVFQKMDGNVVTHTIKEIRDGDTR